MIENQFLPASVKPIIVILVWRGGERFQRALESLRSNEEHFSRVILSITSPIDSLDMRIAEAYVESRARSDNPSKAEIICTGEELPTMQHQTFWIEYLFRTGAAFTSWIYWLAYDDEVMGTGIESIIDEQGSWPLETGVCYLGPWVVRHESARDLWVQVAGQNDETWTAFMHSQTEPISAIDWVGQQLVQPTYLQMSGSVAQLGAHHRLVHDYPKKSGPMRIEMATAIAAEKLMVAQFAKPITVVYGRSDSDRSNYGRSAYKEDAHLLLLMIERTKNQGRLFRQMLRMIVRVTYQWLRRLGKPVREEWRVMPNE